MIFSFYIFYRQHCVVGLEFSPSSPASSSSSFSSSRAGSCSSTLPTSDRLKLLSGLLHSMRQFACHIAPGSTNSVVAFNSFQTPLYKLHYLETLSGNAKQNSKKQKLGRSAKTRKRRGSGADELRVKVVAEHKHQNVE
eukprot:GHVT01075680.1.p1 GENE.GHVT01075680.1~~GHVT01075680.1.p1  ORF type:complete len:138 (+),score=33.20 GHVT01075680.1:481-894(+)